MLIFDLLSEELITFVRRWLFSSDIHSENLEFSTIHSQFSTKIAAWLLLTF